MEILINGNKEDGDYSTITDLLFKRDLDPKKVIVELNSSILPKSEYDKTVLKDGDVLELVHFVGGG